MMHWFQSLDVGGFLGVMTVANVGMYLLSWLVVAVLQRRYRSRSLNSADFRLGARDLGLSLVIVVVNILVSLPGFVLWRQGAIVLSSGVGIDVLVDSAYLLAFFDVTMYLLHRLMHRSPLYERIHARHHQHRDVGGVSLFVMNPLEALGFGALLVAALMLRDCAFAALLAFLTLNWLYGTVGHSGVHFQSRTLRWIAGDSRFHHSHHAHGDSNYGFFTPLWDDLFGTRCVAQC